MARTYIKSGKNFDKAEQLMRKLLSDSANQKNEKIYVVLCEAVKKQYEAANMKLYLRQQVDSAATFELLRKLFRDCESLDSIEAEPDNKGRVKTRSRIKNASYLNTYRKNLFGGAAFHIRKQKYAAAFTLLDTYLDCSQQPLFSQYSFIPDSIAAYWALYCGYKLQNPEITLKYRDLALKDSSHLEYALQYLAETYKIKKETFRYHQTLSDGFNRFPQNPYFFTYLMDYYKEQNLTADAMSVVDKALSVDSLNLLFLYAKSNLMLNAGCYDDCIAICDSIIALNDSMPDAYYNAGVAYINKAFLLEKSKVKNAKIRKQIKQNYSLSLPYIERYRALKPEEKDKWGAALYNIYLQLNMGKQFEEIDRLLR